MILAGLSTATATASEHTIYVIQRTMHLGLVLPTAEFSRAQWPVSDEVLQWKYVELGWGDEKIYRSQWNQQTMMLQLRALAVPTNAVLLYLGYNAEPESLPFYQKVFKYRVSGEAFARLLGYIRESHQQDASGNFELVEKERMVPVFFYAATGQYIRTNTCNTWTAGALESAGIISPPKKAPVTAKQVLKLLSAGGLSAD